MGAWQLRPSADPPRPARRSSIIEEVELSSAYTAGATSCPKCGSMQTDQAYSRGSEDTEVLQWTCYACDHRWLATDSP